MAQGTCSAEGCGRFGRVVRGWCTKHYQTWKRLGDPLASAKPTKSTCAVDDCGDPTVARNVCRKHYARQRATGTTDLKPKKPRQSAEERRLKRSEQYQREKLRINASICRLEDCDHKADGADGLCAGHYRKQRRYGDPYAARRPRERKPSVACSMPDCVHVAKCRTWCLKHYQSWRKHGDPHGRPVVAPAPCSVRRCGSPALARTYCQNHYAVWRRHGDPEAAKPRGTLAVRCTVALPPVQRFWARVDRRGPIPARRPDLGRCWLWLGGLNRSGYGQTHIFVKQFGTTLAHRVSWRLTGYELVEGMHLDHLCKTHDCVNPRHLDQVLPRINYLRGNGFSAINARKTHCSRGHKLTGDNIRRSKRGQRQCRACDAVNYRMRRGSVAPADLKVSDDYRRVIRSEPCLYCGGQSTQADHYFPASKLPGDHWWRLVPACAGCNSRKSARCGTAYLLLAKKGRRRASRVA